MGISYTHACVHLLPAATLQHHVAQNEHERAFRTISNVVAVTQAPRGSKNACVNFF